MESTGQGPAKTYTIHVAIHEVIVEVVALGPHNVPVSDLKKDEFQVFEVGKAPKRLFRNIVAFRAVDPAMEEDAGSTASGGFVVKASAGCAMSFTRHYRLAFKPTSRGRTGGKHEIVVTTSHPHVTLAYDPEYYVGISSALVKPKLRDNKAAGDALREAACGGRPEVPSSIALNAHLIRTADSDPLRISVVVQPDSLPFLSMSNGSRKVALDYGACTFDAGGKALTFVKKPVERVLSADDYAQVMATGFPNLVELPRANGTAMVRFVVLDRETGNLGSADVVTTLPPDKKARTSVGSGLASVMQGKDDRQTEGDALEVLTKKADIAKMLSGENPGTFGSIVPSAGAMCGDVYELKNGTSRLPDYWNHLETGEPVGAVYTDSLKVPYQMPEGIPGLTSRREWFGIDYHGKFWIQTTGKYHFQMFSDDGAEMYIDDELVIDDDGVHSLEKATGSIELTAGMHTIHVPYFQQEVHAGLILIVQPPDEEWRVFDVRKFSPPAAASSETRGDSGGAADN
ncbi:MAG TPA: PA14 domain-containing protein [Acidobacteriaceae bacterium]|nr:PA14 domain-containing protein [Acidobacteriaceae bacterium]